MRRQQHRGVGPGRGRPHALRPHLDAPELAAVFVGGSIGAVARSALAQQLAVPSGSWPWATFTVNAAGALLLAYLITHLQERLPPSKYSRSFLGSGLCGALTTFSTMMVELLRMLDGDHWALALGYAAASLGCGLAAVALATKAVRRARFAR